MHEELLIIKLYHKSLPVYINTVEFPIPIGNKIDDMQLKRKTKKNFY